MKSDPITCSTCGNLIPADAPAGLCPICLIQGDADTMTDSKSVATLTPAPARLQPGDSLGDFKILQHLGSGGMGDVYEAVNASEGRHVALKVMNHALTSESDKKRFIREGRLAASINHPNIVYVYGSHEIDGRLAISMELAHDGTLKDLVRKNKSLDIKRAVALTLQMIEGLETAANAGILHRDIKPSNCFLTQDGHVKIGDFGLSISTTGTSDSFLTTTGSGLGTPAFASPEQLRGQSLNIRSDLYSVGATLYFLLTGKVPVEGEDLVKTIAAVLDQKPAAPHSLRPDIPKGLSRILLKCLEKDPAHRYADYAQLRRDLLPFSEEPLGTVFLGQRVMAGLVDDLFASILPSSICIFMLGRTEIEQFQLHQNLNAGLLLLGMLLWSTLYYGLTEGIWGSGPGKLLCRLKVQSIDGGPPGILRASLRAFILNTGFLIPSVIGVLWISPEQYRHVFITDGMHPSDGLVILGLLMLVTMRKRNGFAAVHDLITGTRVVKQAPYNQRPSLEYDANDPSPRLSPFHLNQLGPYTIQGMLSSSETYQLLEGYDPALNRHVWIIRSIGNDNSVSLSRRNLSRNTRLRWLNGIQDTSGFWNIFEAPEGKAWSDLRKNPLRWSSLKFWAFDLAEEYRHQQKENSEQSSVTVDCLWVSSNGQAILLDFPAPAVEVKEDSDNPKSISNVQGFQKFLSDWISTSLASYRKRTTSSHPQACRHVLECFEKEVIQSNLRSFRQFAFHAFKKSNHSCSAASRNHTDARAADRSIYFGLHRCFKRGCEALGPGLERSFSGSTFLKGLPG